LVGEAHGPRAVWPCGGGFGGCGRRPPPHALAFTEYSETKWVCFTDLSKFLVLNLLPPEDLIPRT
jgi:hypothetical protein